MSLQWTFIATFLYTEIFICLLLMLPFISASRWQKVFKSKLLKAFSSYANVYFNIFILILLVLFIDSIRDVRRFSVPSEEVDLKNNPSAEAVIHMKLFRAQRNFYIAGFALFLFVVLRKLVVLISTKATLEADVLATRKQAESATAVAKQMMEDQDNKKNESKKLESSVDSSELEVTKKDLDKTREELRKAQIDLKGMRSQAESLHKEYDRLSAEHASLQNKARSGGDKKDD